MSLDEARRDIDRVDAEIVRLLDERGRIGRRIGRLKRELARPLHQPGRAADGIARRLAQADGSVPPDSLAAVYRIIMAETLALQTKPVAGHGAAAPCSGPAAAGKQAVAAVVRENAQVAPGYYRMRLQAPALAGLFRPGQFFQITAGAADSAGPFLRRPFAPGEFFVDGISFYYAVVGVGTRRLADLGAGSTVRVLAPLGNAFTQLASGPALLIGGGCGVPSLAPLAHALKARGVRVVVIAGARTANAVLDHNLFKHSADRVIIAPDDGSAGCPGTTVDAFRLEHTGFGAVDRLYALGPVPMLRSVAALAEETGTDCEVSLDERMACGFGACMGCAVLVNSGDGETAYRRVCHDGPVFNAKTIAWNG
ncbi:MAG: chorismate mutase [Planctomycetes bacterium]|nr:chorismate mutase [Planctomycetota bacterium]